MTRLSGFMLAIAFATGSTAVHAETVLRLSHVGSPTSSQHLAAVKMAEAVSAKTRGALRIDVHPNSVLGNDAKSIADVKSGALDMTMAGSGNFVSLAPRLAEIDQPYSFQSAKEAWKELDSPLYGKAMLKETSAAGIKSLAFWEVGFRIITSNKGFINSPADLKGLRLRVGNSTQTEFFKELGAQTVSMPLGELHAALKADKLDAQDHPLSISYSAKLYEVQKYFTMTRHAYTALMVTINQKRFEGLSPAHQTALLEAAVIGRDFQRALNAKEEASTIADLRGKGVQVQEKVESHSFRVQAIKHSSQFFSDRYSAKKAVITPTSNITPTTPATSK